MFNLPILLGETKVELLDADEHTTMRKVRKVGWLELEPINTPVGNEFNLDNINSLWYHQLDYRPFLQQQLVTLVYQDRVKGFLIEYRPLRLIKSFIVQMARSTQLLLAIMPTLVKILRKHLIIIQLK